MELSAGQDEGSELSTEGPFTSHGTLLFTCVLPTQSPADGQSEVVDVEVPVNSTVTFLRLLVWVRAAGKSATPSTYQLSSPDCFQLLYRKGPTWYEIFDNQQILQTLDSVRYWRNLGCRKGQIFMKQRARETAESQCFWDRMAQLIGCDVRTLVTSEQDELNSARRKLAAVRQAELQDRDARAYAMEPWLDTSPLPEGLLALATKDLVVAIHHGSSSRKMKVSAYHTPDMVIHTYFQRMQEKGLPVDPSDGQLVLKVCGREEYLTGNWSLLDFCWVRHCLKNKEELHLALVPPLAEDEVAAEEDWPLVDEDTGLSLTHQQMTLSGRGAEEVSVLSLWDCHHPFRVKLLGLDSPSPPGKGANWVYVEVSVLHGTLVLSSARTPSLPLADEVLWNIWLDLDLLVRDLPRGCRLGLLVYGLDEECSPPARDARDPRLLHHASLPLIDHRSHLQQGERVLHLWPHPGGEGGPAAHQLHWLPARTNPELHTSAALCILLDTYDWPVVLPSGPGPAGRGPDTGGAPAGVDAGPGQQTDAFGHFTEQCGRYSRSLPPFLGAVPWGEQRAVQEVQWLLRRWDPARLELPDALQLLGAPFPDPEVRRLSVRRLQRLRSGEVRRYLLQLVQALKFEPYHDSSLARFLIGWALRSKTIGHFFFWYCRAEVTGSAHCADRYAVILEAYLLGCGRALLESFQRQVQLVTALSRVATHMKTAIAEKSDVPHNAASLLQDLLRKAGLPQDFVTPYNPRIKAGRILVDRCKVMASKKKPLWLEFTWADPEGSPHRPIGIIFKHGDDLRQDMLILQALVIMDSIWQENSLDLNLIPYGCISTGYNIGMIEAVGGAATIAAVQRMKGGNSGAFKNDALHDWLRNKLQVEEEYYHAMETFVTSCAGYCVATYVLGIGDRHNDNIMITEQGNLFHIDFGHILGNRKRILGVNRERAPFVLTPDFLYVMGRVNRRPSLYFQRFKDTCIQAYLSLRAHSPLLINLFSLMLLTGIPELSCTRDIAYLREALAVGSEEQAAREHFLSQISLCESLGWTVQASWWIHMFMGIKQA